MKLDLSMLVQELAVLLHTPVEHNEVSAYVLTHIFAPLRDCLLYTSPSPRDS